MENIVKLEIIVQWNHCTEVIMQCDKEVLRIESVIKNLMYLKKIPIAFHNGSYYDYRFTIKELG